jgi:hypothetical protein
MGIENALCYIVYTTNVSMTFLVLLYPEQVPVKQRYFVMHSEINASKPPEPEVWTSVDTSFRGHANNQTSEERGRNYDNWFFGKR